MIEGALRHHPWMPEPSPDAGAVPSQSRSLIDQASANQSRCLRPPETANPRRTNACPARITSHAISSSSAAISSVLRKAFLRRVVSTRRSNETPSYVGSTFSSSKRSHHRILPRHTMKWLPQPPSRQTDGKKGHATASRIEPPRLSCTGVQIDHQGFSAAIRAAHQNGPQRTATHDNRVARPLKQTLALIAILRLSA
ncbi:hypothetical protein ACVW0J_000081 [Bradyrhizobium sp. i1.7.7]